MSAIELSVIHAFTMGGEGGNPAGVVLDADGLSQDMKQAIAREAGLPETAFVSRSDLADIKLDFFTPKRQIAHCGHATIAVFAHLNAIGRLTDGLHTKETIDGLRQASVTGGRAAMEQRAPRFTGIPRAAALSALGLVATGLSPNGEPVCIDTGNRFVVVGVSDTQALARMSPDQAALEGLSDDWDLIGAYVFSTDAQPGFAATARMFAPRFGIPEEAATGMAAGPLAALMAVRGLAGDQLAIEQGRYMRPASPSRLNTEVRRDARGAIGAIWVSGEARLVSRRTIRLEELV